MDAEAMENSADDAGAGSRNLPWATTVKPNDHTVEAELLPARGALSKFPSRLYLETDLVDIGVA